MRDEGGNQSGTHSEGETRTIEEERDDRGACRVVVVVVVVLGQGGSEGAGEGDEGVRRCGVKFGNRGEEDGEM